jgi:hypothetical protein
MGKVLLLYLKGIPHAPFSFQTGQFFFSIMGGDWYGFRSGAFLMGQPTPTPTSAGDRDDAGLWLSVDDVTSVRLVILVHHASG